MQAHKLLSTKMVATVALALCGAVFMPVANGHLGIIRQGRESAGVMQQGARHGISLCSGDFDGDGFADLATGSLAAVNSQPNAGAVVINYGRRTGLTHIGADLRTQDSLGHNSNADDRFSAAMAAGDFNNDGKDDLAIGAPGDVGGRGSFIVVYGSAAGLLPAGVAFDQSAFANENTANDNFGHSLAAGDFDGDGYDDLAVGIIGEDVGFFTNTAVNAGAVRIYYGGPSGLGNSGSREFTQDDIPTGAADNAWFGQAVAAGDINHDGRDDLVIGISRRNFGGFTECGAAAVLYGSVVGLTAVNSQYFTQANFGEVAGDFDYFGMVVAMGDANGDGFADVAIATPFHDFNANNADTGRVYVLYGSAAGLNANNSTILDPVNSVGATPNDKYGTAMAFGDYTGDGKDELAVSLPFRTILPAIGGGSAPQAGLVVMYYGDNSGVRAANPVARTQNDLFEFPENGDHFGASLVFGAFDGGVRAGMAVGSPDENFDPNPNTTPTPLEDTGAVNIDLSWRQVQGIRSRVCLLMSCEGEILFSQKLFEQHYLASTTKIMTLLLACEAVQAPNPQLQLSDIYTFPALFTNVAPNGTVGGSMAGLCASEQISVLNLMYAMMLVSGNDAAFGLADMVVNKNNVCNGTGCSDQSTFRNMMNQRAVELGMLDTTFGNPSGAGLGSWASNNRSTPADMYLLARFAMQNPLFRMIVGTESYGLPRNVPPASCVSQGTISSLSSLAFALPGGETPDFPGFAGSGVKGGSGAGAGSSTIAAADLLNGRIFALVYGEPSRTPMKNDAIALLKLAAEQYCQPDIQLPPIPPSPPGVVKEITNIPAHTHHGGHLPFPLTQEADRPVVVRLTPSAGSPSAAAHVELERVIEADLPPGERTQHTIAPFMSHGGISVTNLGENRATLRVTFDPGGFDQTATLPPGAALLVPAFMSPILLDHADLVVMNLDSSLIAVVEIREANIGYDLNLPAGQAFAARLTAGRSDGQDMVHVRVFGADPSPSAGMDLLVANTIDTDPGCDGVLDANDVDAFVRAVLDPTDYQATYPACYIGAADLNGDGRIDAEDVAPFVNAIIGG